MIELVNQTKESLAERLAFARNLYETEKDPSTLLAMIYREYIPEASIEQGQLIADHVMMRIRDYGNIQAAFSALPEDDRRIGLKGKLSELLSDKSLHAQCQRLFFLCENLDQTSISSDPAAGGSCFYSGSISEEARDELLENLADKILACPDPDNFLPWQLLDAPQARTYTKEMGNDLYRAVLSTVFYTLLLDPDCSELLNGSPVSLDFVVCEVCACASDDPTLPPPERALNWSVLKWMLSAAIIAGDIVIFTVATETALVAATYMLSLYAIIGLFVYADELAKSKSFQEEQEAQFAAAAAWARTKARIVAAAKAENAEETDEVEASVPEIVPDYES